MDIVTVPNGLPAEALKRAGAFTLWRLDGTVDYQKLALTWHDAELEDENMPDVVGESVAHHRACNAQARGSAKQCVKLADNGWALVEASNTDDDAGADVDFSTALRCWRNEDESLRFAPEDDARTGIIEEDYYRFQQELSPNDISTWLIRQVHRLRAVPLRDTGGVYYMPPESMTEWRAIIDVLKACTRHSIYAVPALENDADTVALIVESVTIEAEAMLKKLTEDIADEESRPGERGLKSRKVKLATIEDKLGRYEKLLGTSLHSVRDKLDVVDDEVSLALIAAVAEKDRKATEKARGQAA